MHTASLVAGKKKSLCDQLGSGTSASLKRVRCVFWVWGFQKKAQLDNRTGSKKWATFWLLQGTMWHQILQLCDGGVHWETAMAKRDNEGVGARGSLDASTAPTLALNIELGGTW